MSRRITLALLLYLACRPLLADEPVQKLTGYAHTGWTTREGAPGLIQALAQTTDGTLWLASETGLYRFDGIRFERFNGPPEQPLTTDLVSALFAPSSGGLWVGFRLGGLAFIGEDGMVVPHPVGKGPPEATVNAITRDRDGTLWIGTTAGVRRLAQGTWEDAAAAWGLPTGYAFDLAVDRSGAVRMRVDGHLYFLTRGSHRFIERPIPYESPGKKGFVAEGPDSQLWLAGTTTGVRPLAGPADARSVSASPKSQSFGWPLLFDREGALWYFPEEGAFRLTNPRSVTDARATGDSPHIERFAIADGLTSPYVNSAFEDREGNIWTGTNVGLNRFTPTNLKMVVQGDASSFAMVSAKDGSMWWSSQDQVGGRSHILHFLDGTAVSQLETPEILTCAYQDDDGSFWFGGTDGLWRLEGKTLRPVPEPPGTRGSDVQAMVRDRSGGLWLSIPRRGVFRYSEGAWARNGNLAGLPDEAAITMARDSSGRMWFGYRNERVALVEGRSVRMLGSGDGLQTGNVTAIGLQGDHVWIGGERGLTWFDGKRFVPVRVASKDYLRGLWGVVETAAGEIWASGTSGIVHLTRGQVGQILRNEMPREPLELFDSRDGLPGNVQSLRPQPAVVEGRDGKVWFAFSGGLGYIDPIHIVHNSVPPPVTIMAVNASGREYSAYSNEIRLPVGTTQLRIGYTANSLSVPQRVRFRYRLEGLDPGWQDVGDRREAIYTNVAPGTYRFQVIAANNDGVWNETGASRSLIVLPAFYQTTWFYVVGSLAAAALLFLVFWLRVRQVTATVRARLEQRIAERERIARDLHDTLLQGLQGLILRFQAVGARIPPHERASEMMEGALTRADEVLIESRDRVKNLRSSSEMQSDLSSLLSAAGQQFAQEHPAEFSIAIEGDPRNLHPILKEEALMIGREALSNAFRHASARKIELEIAFGTIELRLSVRDDGRGVDPDVLQSGGRAGHWGLRGMQERAREIRAHLDVWSRPGLGTEVQLRVPASIAYRARSEGRRWRWRRRLAQ